MIAVTCRNGEHFSVDPVSIERVETDPDTVIHLVDGTKYVVTETFDDLLLVIRDHRATVTVAQKPADAGIDPYLILLDLERFDNVEEVEIES